MMARTQSRPPRRLELAVIVVCYHSDTVLQACIDALDSAVAALPSALRCAAHLVLVANSPVDMVDAFTSGECTVTALYAGENLGFAPAVNLGLSAVPDAEDARMKLLLSG